MEDILRILLDYYRNYETRYEFIERSTRVPERKRSTIKEKRRKFKYYAHSLKKFIIGFIE